MCFVFFRRPRGRQDKKKTLNLRRDDPWVLQKVCLLIQKRHAHNCAWACVCVGVWERYVSILSRVSQLNSDRCFKTCRYGWTCFRSKFAALNHHFLVSTWLILVKFFVINHLSGLYVPPCCTNARKGSCADWNSFSYIDRSTKSAKIRSFSLEYCF